MIKAVLLGLFCLIALAACAEDYSGHQVWRFSPKTAEELENLVDFAHKRLLDIWQIASQRLSVDIRVAPDQHEIFTDLKISHEVYVEDVQDNIELERETFTGNISGYGLKAPDFFDSYHSFAENVAYMEDLAQKYPQAEIMNIGKSIEGRDLIVLKVSSGSPNAKSVWVQGTIHAREWITTPTVCYFATKLLETYDNNKNMVGDIDWYILAVANPDGFEYSRMTSRMWRKNRRVNPGSSFRGVDLNRNFGYQWNTGGSSNNPRDDTYHGTGPFSEPETDNVQKFVMTLPNFAGFVDVHAYGQYWLYPWGYTRNTLPADDGKMRACAVACVDEIKRQPEAKTYTYGNSAIHLYVASGGADDWGYGGAKGVYSYTLELRDTGRYGFNLPASEILPTAEEIWAAMNVYAEHVNQN